MSGYYGLIELVLVFGIVLALGLWQLYSVRRDSRRAGDGGPGRGGADRDGRSSADRRGTDGIER